MDRAETSQTPLKRPDTSRKTFGLTTRDGQGLSEIVCVRPHGHWSSLSVLRRALDGVDDEYIDGAALRVELQSELFLQRRID